MTSPNKPPPPEFHHYRWICNFNMDEEVPAISLQGFARDHYWVEQLNLFGDYDR